MTPERWQRIDEIFQAAVILEPSERAAFLEKACAGDQNLNDKVATMLASDDRGWELIEHAALEVGAPILADDRPQLTPEQHIGHYDVVHLIGRGGMGEVYLAKDQRLNRKIALKLLPADYIGQHDRLRRFQQEAQSASALNHPNILTIYEIGQIDDQQFIATEFVEGDTLRERVKSGPLSSTEAMDIAIQISGALAAAHNAGIIHRDIKPENIMLRPDGYVKVVDFGLAKLTEQNEPILEPGSVAEVEISSALVMGTVKYMSPEQAQGKPVDGRSDIFSLGVVLYEMLTGRAPFEGKNAGELVQSIVTKEPVPVRDLVVEIPIELDRIVRTAMNKAKTRRYETAEQLLVDLKQVRQSQDVTMSQPGIRTAAKNNSTDDSRTTRLSSAGLVVSRIRENRIGAAVAFVILVVVAGLAIYALRNFASKKRVASFENAMVTTISTAEVTGSAAISPDGKLMAFLSQKSLVLSPADGNGSPTQILSDLKGRVFGLVFSGDGQWLYFNHDENGTSPLYRTSINASGAVKVLDHVHSRVTFSPDGQQLAFIRSYVSEGESALIVANVDGTGEKRLAMRKGAAYFSGLGLSWSPDGKEIAAAVEGGSVNESALIRVDVSNGAESRINTPTDWPRFRDVAWLSDGSLVVVVTEGGPTATTQMWQLSFPAWTPKKITDTDNVYESISLAKSSDALLAVERRVTSDIWISPLAGNSAPTQITYTTSSGRGGVCWMPDGRFIYHSRNLGRDELWRMDADGSNPLNLTPDSHGNLNPSAPATGGHSVFMSRRTGAFHIWRLDVETGSQVQLTSGFDEQFSQVTANGKWVYYVSWDSGTGTVWKVSINGGQAQQVVNESSLYPNLSPDGKLLAYVGFDNETPLRKVVSVKDLHVKHSFRGGLGRLWIAHWSRSGDALLYLDQREGVWNVWSQPLAGSEPKQLTQFNDGRIYFFDLSPDGRELVLSRGHESRALVLFRAGT